MKKQIPTKKHNLWRGVLDWLKLRVKILRRKLAAKGKASESLPKEAPH